MSYEIGHAADVVTRAGRATTEGPMANPVRRPAARGRGLAVDDNGPLRAAYRRLLALCGLEAASADDGSEAVPMVRDADARGEPFDLILMDLDMPVMDGWAATETLRRGGFAGVIIAVSGTADADAPRRALRRGFDHFVAKPTTADELIGLINAYMAPARLPGDRAELAMADGLRSYSRSA
jgi:CheY-like chemotaxis protein